MFIFRVVLVPDYVETHPSLHLFSRLLSFSRRLHRTDERRCRLSFYCRNAVSESVRSGRWRCVAPGGLAVALLPKAVSCGSSGMPSLCGFVPWQRSICSVDDLNGRSYAKFHPSFAFFCCFSLASGAVATTVRFGIGCSRPRLVSTRYRRIFSGYCRRSGLPTVSLPRTGPCTIC